MYLEWSWGLGPPTPLVRCIWCFDVVWALDLDGDWLGSYDSATKSIFKAVSIVGIKAAEFLWQSVSWSKTWLSNSIKNWTEAFGICECDPGPADDVICLGSNSTSCCSNSSDSNTSESTIFTWHWQGRLQCFSLPRPTHPAESSVGTLWLWWRARIATGIQWVAWPLQVPACLIHPV